MLLDGWRERARCPQCVDPEVGIVKTRYVMVFTERNTDTADLGIQVDLCAKALKSRRCREIWRSEVQCRMRLSTRRHQGADVPNESASRTGPAVVSSPDGIIRSLLFGTGDRQMERSENYTVWWNSDRGVGGCHARPAAKPVNLSNAPRRIPIEHPPPL